MDKVVSYNTYKPSPAEEFAVLLREQNFTVDTFDEEMIRCSNFLVRLDVENQYFQIGIPTNLVYAPPLDSTLSLVTFDGEKYFLSSPFNMVEAEHFQLQLEYVLDQIDLIKRDLEKIPTGFILAENKVDVVNTNLTETVAEVLTARVIDNLRNKMFIIRGMIGSGKKTMVTDLLTKQKLLPLFLENEAAPIPKLIETLVNLKQQNRMCLVLSEILGNQLLDSISYSSFIDLIRVLHYLSRSIPVVIITDRPPIENTIFKTSPFSAITINLFKQELEEIYCMQIIKRILNVNNIKFFPAHGQIANPLYSIIQNST